MKLNYIKVLVVGMSAEENYIIHSEFGSWFFEYTDYIDDATYWLNDNKVDVALIYIDKPDIEGFMDPEWRMTSLINQCASRTPVVILAELASEDEQVNNLRNVVVNAGASGLLTYEFGCFTDVSALRDMISSI
ncbi:MAG: hypothetical protein JNL70_01370 [Saprospiraceae bacterium]|nr:hypothetical protein [Saprospiraceae bacterium]